MIEKHSMYINGLWQESSDNKVIDVINPDTEQIIGLIPIANSQDVDNAAQAAKTAFISWQQISSEQRADYIKAIANKLIEYQNEMAEIISAEQGIPLTFAKSVQVAGPIHGMLSYVDICKTLDDVQQIGNSTITKEAIGVCGLITPWNYPLHQLIGKVAPALAAGCTMVVKPSEETPLSTLFFAKLIDEVALPKGVFNLITGNGETTGNALTQHPDIDMISFTGSTSAGIKIAINAAPTVKRVCQELGGKSPNLIAPNTPLEQAISDAITSVMFNSGQTCVAATRVLIHQNDYQQAINLAKQVAESLIVGRPTDETSFMGPMCSAKQKATVLNYIQKGIDEGARLVTGGLEMPDGLNKGFYVKPTVFANVNNDMVIAREEIFGPVICLIPYKNLAQALEIANDSDYGLAAKVWAETKEQAIEIAKSIRAGQITINGGQFNYLAPFGGFKRSGNGREWGKAGLNEYVELKSMQC
jgi:aldehyde dehydrogenase (NAD+)